MDDEQVDVYLVHRIAGMNEEAVKNLSADVETISNDRLSSVIDFLEKKVRQLSKELEEAAGTDR